MKKRIIAILMSLVFVSSFCIDAKAEMKDEYIQYIEEVSELYGLSPELIESIIENESCWKEDAVNKDSGCKGLGQINGKVHKPRMERLEVTDLTNPYENILVMCDYLAELFEEYEEPETVLMIYTQGNNGLTRAKQGKVSGFVKVILKRSEELEIEHRKIGDIEPV